MLYLIDREDPSILALLSAINLCNRVIELFLTVDVVSLSLSDYICNDSILVI